jgi:glyoxylase I family protein
MTNPNRSEPHMLIDHVLAVVPVTDITIARDWYTRLVGREPDNTPMDTLVEWQLADRGWLQVTVDADRAGRGQLNLAVNDLRAAIEEIEGRGIVTGEVVHANKGVEFAPVSDPDGNVVSLLGNFRVRY